VSAICAAKSIPKGMANGRDGARLCENMHERRARSIVFFIVFPHSGFLFFRLTKSRKIFYAQI